MSGVENNLMNVLITVTESTSIKQFIASLFNKTKTTKLSVKIAHFKMILKS